MTPKFSRLSNSLLIGLKAAKVTLLFSLNTEVVFSLNFAFAFVHVQRHSEKTSENFLFNSVLNFSVAVISLVVTLFTWLQNELIGRSERSNKAIQSVPNKFVVIFYTSIAAFLIFPMKETLQANSPKKFNFLLDTPQATFLEVLTYTVFFPSLSINYNNIGFCIQL